MQYIIERFLNIDGRFGERSLGRSTWNKATRPRGRVADTAKRDGLGGAQLGARLWPPREEETGWAEPSLEPAARRVDPSC